MGISNFRGLRDEVERIIRSPYPVALKTLYDKAQACSKSALLEWSTQSEDQIPLLAATLVEGIDLWPGTLDVLSILCVVTELRDAVLLQDPLLLQRLLHAAVGSKTADSQASRACQVFLSEALPDAVTLPVQAQTFLMLLFESAVQSPHIARIEPLYNVLDGACGPLLGLLPKASLIQFSEHLTGMMRNVKGIEDQLLSLLCLAIMAKIHHSSRTSASSLSGSTSVATSSDVGWASSIEAQTQNEVHKFFVADRALKTMHLLVLQVIWVCRQSCQLSDDTALKHVRLGRQVLGAIDMQSQEKWVLANPRILQKLLEKVTSAGLPRELAIEAIAFTSSLSGASKPQPLIVSAFERFLENHDCMNLPARALAETMPTILPRLCDLISQECWQNAVCNIFEKINEGEKLSSQTQKLLLPFIQQLRYTATHCETLRCAITHELASNRIAGHLEKFIGYDGRQSSRGRNLKIALVSLLLTTAVCTQADQPNIPVTLTTRLINMQEELVRSSQTRSPVELVRHSSQLTLPPTTTQIQHRPQGSWRELVACEMGNYSRQAQLSIVRVFAESCKDLEERCEGVEEPLKIQTEKCNKLEQDLALAADQTSETRADLQKSNVQVSQLEAQLRDAEQELEAANEAACSSQEEIQRLEERLKDEGEAAQQQLEMQNQEHQKQLLELRVTIATSADALEDKNAKIQDLETGAITMRQTMEADRLRYDEEAQEAARLAEATEQEHKACVKSLRECVKDLEETRREMGDETRMLEQKHALTLAEAEQEVERLRESVDASKVKSDKCIEELEKNREALQRKLTSEIQAKGEAVYELQQKYKTLSRAYHDKELALKEVQKMRTRLFAAIGMDTGQNEGPAEGEGGTVEPQSSFASSSGSSGSSSAQAPKPKRARSHRASAVRPRSSKSDVIAKRVPLRDRTANIGSLPRGAKAPKGITLDKANEDASQGQEELVAGNSFGTQDFEESTIEFG